MIKQTIKYDDYNGEEQNEEFYFNLTKLEIMEMELKFEGGLEGHIKKLMETENGVDAYYLFKDLVLSSYGKKSDDGKRFIKSEEFRTDFESSPALGELIFGFMSEATSAATFVTGLLPSKMVAEVEAEAKKQAEATKPATDTPVELPTAPPVLVTETPIEEKKPQDMSREELLAAMKERNR